jgi:ABC-2 type transport system ATP-binding protein
LPAVFEVHELTKIYPGSSVPANDAVTLEISGGEIFGLLGPNGAGKTTLVRQLAGLTRPTSGSIRLFGHDIVRSPGVVADYVALQPQRPSALLDLTASEAVRHTGRLRGLGRKAAAASAEAGLAALGIAELGPRRIRGMSGGEQRLVSLAVTLVADYPVLILDEPTNDLDPRARRMVWDLLLKLRGEGRTIILVTHDVLEAERVIERLGLINKGRLMALGRTSELRARIDERVRVELTFHESHAGLDLSALVGEHAQVLGQDGERTLLLLPRDRVPAALTAVADRFGPQGLRDLRVSGPTLEDVYLQLAPAGRSDRLG